MNSRLCPTKLNYCFFINDYYHMIESLLYTMFRFKKIIIDHWCTIIRLIYNTIISVWLESPGFVNFTIEGQWLVSWVYELPIIDFQMYLILRFLLFLINKLSCSKYYYFSHKLLNFFEFVFLYLNDTFFFWIMHISRCSVTLKIKIPKVLFPHNDCACTKLFLFWYERYS